jgi:hypothetical protein
MKKFFPLLFLLSPIFNAFAQDEEKSFSADLSVDLVSRYVWRGLNLSESPALQPTLGISYKNFTLGTWSSYTLSRESIQEVDLFLSYEREYLTITINNYYNTLDTLGFTGNYFDMNKATTPHVLEGMITLSGPESFPLSLTAATMFWGNDRKEDGNNFYSTYLELEYPFKVQETEIATFIGITPTNGLYGTEFGVVNLGLSATKSIVVTENFSIPIKGSFMLNPQQEKVFFVISLTL